MTEANLNRTVQHLLQQIKHKEIDFTPIIVSDSKGNYLRRQVRSFSNRITDKIIWWSRSGAKIEETIQWVRRNFDRETRRLGKIVVYLWLGTCDLTTKRQDGRIFLCEQDYSKVEYIVRKYKELSTFLHRAGCRVIILETPYYSIKYWNVYWCQSDREEFSEDDNILKKQIDNLNYQIEEINRGNQVHAPKLNLDLQRSRRKRRGTGYFTDWKLLADGIHPIRIIARIWRLKVALYCYRERI